MRSDFCVFILTHGRPDKVYTVESLRKSGYTGKIYIVIDDEDKTAEEYIRIFGDNVLVFSKDEVLVTEGQSCGRETLAGHWPKKSAAKPLSNLMMIIQGSCSGEYAE